MFGLRHGSTVEAGQRVAGLWALWREQKHIYRQGAPMQEETRIRCARIKRRKGHELHVDTGRVRLAGVWLAAADAPLDEHWPTYNWGDYMPLSPDKARAVLAQAGVEWG